MTDNEIIKALENIINEKIGCCAEDCAFYDGKVHSCEQTIAKYSLDFINRQKAEIDKMKAIVEQSDINCRRVINLIGGYERQVETAKAEAFKEFAERLKTKERPTFPLAMVIDVYEIDKLVKEMVGETKWQHRKKLLK